MQHPSLLHGICLSFKFFVVIIQVLQNLCKEEIKTKYFWQSEQWNRAFSDCSFHAARPFCNTQSWSKTDSLKLVSDKWLMTPVDWFCSSWSRMQLLIYEKKWLILRMLTIFPFKIVGNLKELSKLTHTIKKFPTLPCKFRGGITNCFAEHFLYNNINIFSERQSGRKRVGEKESRNQMLSYWTITVSLDSWCRRTPNTWGWTLSYSKVHPTLLSYTCWTREATPIPRTKALGLQYPRCLNHFLCTLPVKYLLLTF